MAVLFLCLGTLIASSPTKADHCIAQSAPLIRQKDAAMAEYVSASRANDRVAACAALRTLLRLHQTMYDLPESCSHSEDPARLRATLLRDISTLRDTISEDCR